MSLDWKLQRRLGNCPDNLRLSLAISLLLHGVLFLGLELYWRIENHSLPPEPEALIPIKFIEVPPDKVAVSPPLNAKHLASRNSRAGGKARRELPKATGAFAAKSTTRLFSRQPSLTQSKSSTPHLSQPKNPVQQPQSAPRRERLPLTGENPNISPPMARTLPKLKSRSRQPSQQKNPSLLGSRVHPASHNLMSDRTNRLPNTNRLALHGHSNRSTTVSRLPKRNSSSRQPLRQGAASLLGGPVSLASHDFMGTRRGNFPNAKRLATDSEGVDARQEVKLGPYLDRLKRQVEQQWHPEIPNSSEQTMIGFAVSRTGQVTAMRILHSSGSTLIDQAALKALQRAAPFEPLPENYPAAQLNIHFFFNINIYGKLELRN